MAGEHNLKIIKGQTFEEKITWTDSLGVLISFVGCEIQIQIRKKDGILYKDLSNKVINSGTYITLLIESVITETFNYTDSLDYDLFVEKDGKRYKLLKGIVIIENEVTEWV